MHEASVDSEDAAFAAALDDAVSLLPVERVDIANDVDLALDRRPNPPPDLRTAVDRYLTSRVDPFVLVTVDAPTMGVLKAIASGTSLTEVSQHVERAESLSSLVRRLAQAGALGPFGARTDSMPYQLMRLGAGGVRNACLAAAMARAANRAGPLSALRGQLWRAGLASALTSQALAPAAGVSPDDAWLLGLVHDFGTTAAVLAVEEFFFSSAGADEFAPLRGANNPYIHRPKADEFMASSGRVADDELTQDELVAIAQRHHADIGWALCAQWRLPTSITSLTATHHAPKALTLDEKALIDVVLRADRLVGTVLAHGKNDVAAIAAMPDRGTTQPEFIVAALARYGAWHKVLRA